MPSAFFAALALDASAAADEITAEAWTLQPRCQPDPTAPVVVDTSRPLVAFQGTFADPEAKPDEPNSYDRRQGRRPGTESGRPRLIVSSAAIAAAGLAVQQDDLLLRAADNVTWRVSTVFGMAGGSLKLGINLVG